MKKAVSFIFASIIALLTGNPYIALPQSNFTNPCYLDPYHAECMPGEILIKFKDDVEVTTNIANNKITTGHPVFDSIINQFTIIKAEKTFNASESLHALKSTIAKQVKLSNYIKINYESSIDPMDLAELLKSNPIVEFAEPNYFIYTMITEPNDAIYQSGNQWYLEEIKAPYAWDSITGDTNIVIAYIDTGIDWDHPDLDGNIWRNWQEIPNNGIDDDNNGYIDDIRGWDFVNHDNNPMDDNGHGTHVAGIAGAETNNYIGIAGVAWNSKLMALKVLSGNGQGNTSNLADAILYAYQKGASVINMSLGTYGESITVKNALQLAYDTAFLVAAAGNEGYKVDTVSPPNNPYAPMYPACYPFVAGVEAADYDGIRTGFTNFDPSGFVNTSNPNDYNYEIRAPGVNIFSTFLNGGYTSLTGTSMATPIVSGTVALLKAFSPGISNEEIFARLVSFAENGNLKIPNLLNAVLEPDLHFVDYTLIDTIGNADHDHQADANEIIQIYLSIKNTGGYADSVYTVFSLNNPEDSLLVTIIDNTSYIGDLDSASYNGGITAYTTLTGQMDPCKIHIHTDVLNEREIVFSYQIRSKNSSVKEGTFDLLVYNGAELMGVLDTTLILTPDKLWMVNNSFKISQAGVIKIMPGTHLKINQQFINKGRIIAHGTPDSLIFIEGPKSFEGFDAGVNPCAATFTYTRFENINTSIYAIVFDTLFNCYFNEIDASNILVHCSFNIRNCYFSGLGAVGFWGGGYCERSVFDNIDGFGKGDCNLKYNNFCNSYYSKEFFSFSKSPDLYKNNFLYNEDAILYVAQWEYPYPIYDYGPQNQYWGTTDNSKIDNMIRDFWDDATLPIAVYEPKLNMPCDSAHPVVWKILVNGINPYDDYLDPVGAGLARFDIVFSNPVDTLYTPLLSFGVREPFTQHIVMNNAFWNNDATIWTAFFDINLETGDGINILRVKNARDLEGFKIPVEKTGRFHFTIQAASSTSIQFIATPGIGKVFLEWPYPNTEDFLGFNLYRFQMINAVSTDTIILNNNLITDSTFIDYNVVPDSVYHYLYKIVGTDLAESDYSKVVTAIPLSSANGDANGDQVINILDITTMISFILGSSPQPFLFEAADVNYDETINVLDVILIIQMILNQKSTPIPPDYEIQPCYLYNIDDKVYLENITNIAGLQFEISIDQFNEFGILNTLQNFEMGYSISEDKAVVIFYSLSGEEINQGNWCLCSLLNEVKKLNLKNPAACDKYGNNIPVILGYPQNNTIKSDAITIIPNPFRIFTEIRFALTEYSNIHLMIYDNSGHKVYWREISNMNPGNQSIIWNKENARGDKLPTGIYYLILKLSPNTNGSNEILVTKKLIIIN